MCNDYNNYVHDTLNELWWCTELW